MKPYERADAEAELSDAIQRKDHDTALMIAAYLDRLGPPPGASILGAALWYADNGLPVFPLQPGSKVPYPKSRGVLDATTEPDTVRHMFADPSSNIGLATGHRVDVLDFDGPKAHRAWSKRYQADDEVPPGTISWDEHHPPTGVEAWARADVVAVGTVSTPRPGGVHVYVAASGEGNRANIGGLPGVDYRGLGGYVVVPPSSTPIGHYVWLSQLDLAVLG